MAKSFYARCQELGFKPYQPMKMRSEPVDKVPFVQQINKVTIVNRSVKDLWRYDSEPVRGAIV